MDASFLQVNRAGRDRTVTVRAFANHTAAPVVVTLTPEESLALAIELTNTVRVLLARTDVHEG